MPRRRRERSALTDAAFLIAAYRGATANLRREQLPRHRERRLSHGGPLRGSA